MNISKNININYNIYTDNYFYLNYIDKYITFQYIYEKLKHDDVIVYSQNIDVYINRYGGGFDNISKRKLDDNTNSNNINSNKKIKNQNNIIIKADGTKKCMYLINLNNNQSILFYDIVYDKLLDLKEYVVDMYVIQNQIFDDSDNGMYLCGVVNNNNIVHLFNTYPTSSNYVTPTHALYITNTMSFDENGSEVTKITSNTVNLNGFSNYDAIKLYDTKEYSETSTLDHSRTVVGILYFQKN